MGYNNPPVPWRELEAVLSRPDPAPSPLRVTAGTVRPGRTSGLPTSHRRPGPWAGRRRPVSRAPYAELHCHSNFSFLDGASHPEELVEEATRLGLEALAITDHDGMYGVVRFAEAARTVGMPTVFGAELSLGLTRPQNGVADPEGTHLLVLARDPTGYTRLCRALSVAHLSGGEKGRPSVDLETLAAIGAGALPDLAAVGEGTASGLSRSRRPQPITGWC